MKPHSFGGRSGDCSNKQAFAMFGSTRLISLHPKTPIALIDRLNSFGRFLEKVPVIAEFAGSLYIRAVK